MVLGLAKEHSLTFGLPFSAVQGSFNTFSVPLRLYQLTLELLVTFFGHVEGLHGRYTSPFFFLHLPIRGVYHLLSLVCGLNSLSRREACNKEEKEVIKNKNIISKKKGGGGVKGLTMARSLFKPRNTSCFLMDLRLAESLDSKRACSIALAT